MSSPLLSRTSMDAGKIEIKAVMELSKKMRLSIGATYEPLKPSEKPTARSVKDEPLKPSEKPSAGPVIGEPVKQSEKPVKDEVVKPSAKPSVGLMKDEAVKPSKKPLTEPVKDEPVGPTPPQENNQDPQLQASHTLVTELSAVAQQPQHHSGMSWLREAESSDGKLPAATGGAPAATGVVPAATGGVHRDLRPGGASTSCRRSSSLLLATAVLRRTTVGVGAGSPTPSARCSMKCGTETTSNGTRSSSGGRRAWPHGALDGGRQIRCLICIYMAIY